MNDRYFDQEKGIVTNQNGRVGRDGRFEIGLYVSGWLKRGPSGIIGTNIADAKETIASVMEDLENGTVLYRNKFARRDLDLLLQKRNTKVVNWSFFEKIDKAERNISARRSSAQPREKIVRIEDMLSLANF